MIEILAWIAAGCATWLPPQGAIEQFERRLHPYPATSQHDGQLVYHLFRPRKIEPNRTYPLIVWLHGYGKEEFEQEHGHLRHLDNVFPSIDEAQNAEFFLLAVQCPIDQRGYYAGSVNPSIAQGGELVHTPGEAVIEIVKKLLIDEPISREQITLSGVSGGGSACWEMAMRHPKLFAAIAPLGCKGGDLSRISRMRNIPVWAFHTSNDVVTPADAVAHSVSRLQQLGGAAELTLITGNIHDCWYFAFKDYDLLAWLLDQRQGSFSSPPGHSATPWLRHTLTCAMLLIVVLAIRGEVRRQILQRSA